MKTLTQTILILLLLAGGLAGFGQTEYISLGESKIYLPSENYEFVEIIDARTPNCIIGSIGDMNAFSRTRIKMEGDFCEEIKKIFPEPPNTKQALQVIIKINMLNYFQKYIEDINYQLLRMNLSFYVFEEGKYYHEYTSANAIAIPISQPLKHLGNAIFEGFQNAILQFHHRMSNNLNYHHEISENDFRKTPSKLKRHLYKDTSSYKNGVYYTFSNFKDGLKDTTSPLYARDIEYRYEKEGLKDFLVLNDEKECKDIWGVFYQGKYYIRVFDLFLPADYENGELVFHKMIRIKPDNPFRYYFNGDHYRQSFIAYYDAYLGLAVSLTASLIQAEISRANRYRVFHSDFIVDPLSGVALPREISIDEDLTKRIILFMPKHT